MSIQVSVCMLEFKFGHENYKDENWGIFSPNWYCIFNLFGNVEAFAPIWNPFTYFSFFKRKFVLLYSHLPQKFVRYTSETRDLYSGVWFSSYKRWYKVFCTCWKSCEICKIFTYLGSNMEKILKGIWYGACKILGPRFYPDPCAFQKFLSYN